MVQRSVDLSTWIGNFAMEQQSKCGSTTFLRLDKAGPTAVAANRWAVLGIVANLSMPWDESILGEQLMVDQEIP